mmetsp:Transcript_112914/g.326168  ORF Transcript_112914/g.326168 Transcript_112914/m.326168 type:complete len:571 (+) Transcript_112914:124-1836(+)
MPGKPRAADKLGMMRGDLEQQPSGADERTPLKPPGKPAEDSEEQLRLTADPIGWVRSLSNSYSWRLLAMVTCTNHLLKGFVAGGGDEGLVGKPIEFIFGDLGISAGRLQMLKAVAIAPWALKPVVALLSDAMPICGYKKMPYVVITTVGALIGATVLGLNLSQSVPAIVLSLFLIFLQISSVDLLVEAKQSEEVKQKAKLGPQFFTFTWLGINLGQVASVLMLGPMIHHLGPRVPYLLALPFIALVLWPTLSNFLGERPVPVEERGLNLRLLSKHPVLCSLTLMIGVLIMSLILGTFVLQKEHLFTMAAAFAVIVLGSFLCFVRWEITGPVVFYFMLGLLSFNIDGALFYFYTNSHEKYPEGPHFTAYFYTTGLGAATFIGIMAGFITGSELFKSWSYRGILKVTILLRACTQMMLLPVLLRWNRYLGVDDSVWVLCVIAADSVVFAWRWIPKQVMGAHLTPRGMEATMLGLTAGTFNMAMILSSYFGGFLLHYYDVRPVGAVNESGALASLWKVQVLAAFAPCAMLFLLPALIPAKSQTEPLMEERPDSATYRSPFEVMMARRRAEGRS